MSWNGSVIRQKAKELGITIGALAESLNVSRQTITSWINGQIPRGQHLLKLCNVLNTKPEIFFLSQIEDFITVPRHRTLMKRRVTNEMQKASFEIAKGYLNLFKQAPTSNIVPVIRIREQNDENAKNIAKLLRERSGIREDKPMDYSHAFSLLDNLGIYTVIIPFPDIIKKDYAFYSKICENRVVFVNTNIKTIDLIFPLLHETIHAVRDEQIDLINNQDEENFCDLVSNYMQFPDEYVYWVKKYIEDCESGIVVNKLKQLSIDNNHSLCGIYKRILSLGNCKEINNEIKIGGAVTNLKKKFPALGEILIKNGDPYHLVNMLYKLSPLFMQLLSHQIPYCTTRKLGEWLGLDNSIDAKLVKEAIKRIEI